MNYLRLFLAFLKGMLRVGLRAKLVSVANFGRYVWAYSVLKGQIVRGAFDFPFGKFRPFLADRRESGGVARGHYFHQDLYVAQRIFVNQPGAHVDVGSRVDGFGAHVAVFMPVEIWDIRPVASAAANMRFVQRDILNGDDVPADYCDSLSCLHVLEHFGLGRYGDPIAADGHLTGFGNMCKMLRAGGKFYFSTPIGRQRIEFNAHRVFSVGYLLDMFAAQGMAVDGFAYVDDGGDLHVSVDLSEEGVRGNFGCRYGCGIFELRKG